MQAGRRLLPALNCQTLKYGWKTCAINFVNQNQ